MVTKRFVVVFIVSLLGYCQCTQYFKFVRGPPGSSGPPGQHGPAGSLPICDQRIQTLEEQLTKLDLRLKSIIKVSGASDNQCGPEKYTYKLVAEKKNWQGAVDHCKSLGGVLAHSEVRNVYERMHMKGSHGQSLNAAFWYGASDLETEGSWKYLNGDLVDMATVGWRAGETNGGRGENCACGWSNAEIIDHGCHHQYPFFCQFEACQVATGL